MQLDFVADSIPTTESKFPLNVDNPTGSGSFNRYVDGSSNLPPRLGVTVVMNGKYWIQTIDIVAGSRYFVDIAFPAAMLAIEIDGRVHERYDAFEHDRARQNDLVLQGWRVLRFTWAMLVERPDAVLLAIRQALGLEQGR